MFNFKMASKMLDFKELYLSQIWRSQNFKGLGVKALLVLALMINVLLTGCNDSSTASSPVSLNAPPPPIVKGKLSEVSTPPLIEQLSRSLDQYQPQVKILSPQPEQVLNDTTVPVKLAVQDLPIFQNADLEMGPHLHLILDNQPYQAIYDVDQPVTLADLEPGTHTLRVFPVRPWHESFKNDGAYAQTTFHVLTKSSANRPDTELPLLTYSRPKGSYGAQPILLDFYLTNAPLHLAAQEDQNDAIADWRIRVTINDESFLMDHWQPVYLKGFKPGKNWVKLEFIDEQGNLVPNTFNNTVRVIDYQPNGQDTLSKLVRGELSPIIAKALVDNTVTTPVTPPEEIVIPSPAAETPAPEVEEALEVSPIETDLPLKNLAEETTLSPEPEAVPTLDPSQTLPTVPESPVKSEEVKAEVDAITPSVPVDPPLQTPELTESIPSPEIEGESPLNPSSALQENSPQSLSEVRASDPYSE